MEKKLLLKITKEQDCKIALKKHLHKLIDFSKKDDPDAIVSE
jgi:hypothetical protein